MEVKQSKGQNPRMEDQKRSVAPSLRSLLLIGSLCLSLFPVQGVPAEFCVESKFTEVDEEKMRKEDQDPQWHFLITSPPYLRNTTGRKLISLKQRQLVRGYRGFPEVPLSLAPLSVTGYRDIQSKCASLKLYCLDDEILVPYLWESSSPETQKKFKGFSPQLLALAGPPLYDVLEQLRRVALPPEKKFEAITALSFLEKNFGPLLLEDLLDAQKSQTSPYRDQERIHVAFQKKVQSSIGDSYRPGHPQEYFLSHFPQPQAVILKLGRATGTSDMLTLTDIQFVIQEHEDLRLLPTQKALYPKTSRWCLPQDPNQQDLALSYLQKPTIDIEYIPGTSPQPAVVPNTSSQEPVAVPKAVQASLFSVLRDPYAMTDEHAWDQAWMLNVLAQVQRALFMNLAERELVQAEGGQPPQIAVDERYLSELWSEITQITEDHRSTHGFTRVQTWINIAYDWLWQPLKSEFVIHKGIDVPQSASEGRVVRAHTFYGKSTEGKTIEPAFRLSREQVAQLFSPMADIPLGSQYLIGAQKILQWVQIGIYQGIIQGKFSGVPALQDGESLELNFQDPTAWQAQTWLRPKHSEFFGLPQTLPLQRWSEVDQPLVVAGQTWRKVAQWMHQLSQLPSEIEGRVEARLHLDQAKAKFCSGSPEQTGSVRLCHYPGDSFGSFYFGLSALDDVAVLRFDFHEGQPDVDVFFETLGAVVESPESLGQPEVLPYEKTTLGQMGLPPEYFLRRLADNATEMLAEKKLGFSQLFDLIGQPEPVYQKPYVGDRFSSSDYLIYTFPTLQTFQTPLGPQQGFQVDVLIQSKTALDTKPLEITLPPSCVYSGDQPRSPQLIQATDFIRFLDMPLTGPTPVPATLVTIACASGDILFFIDGEPLRCDAQEDRSWVLNQALFAKPVFTDFKDTSVETTRQFIQTAFCKSPQELNEARAVFETELRQFWTEGAPEIQMIRVVSEHSSLRVFLGRRDGAIYTVKLTPEVARLKTTWKMEIPLAPDAYDTAQPVHFRANLNPFSTSKLKDARYHRLTDLVSSRPLSLEMLQSLYVQLRSAADRRGFVDSCSVTAEGRLSAFEKLLFNFEMDPQGISHISSAKPLYLLFLLTSSENGFSVAPHALTKLVWLPEIFPEPDLSKASDIHPCMRLLKKVLGHGLSIELNLTSAQSLKAFYPDVSPVPHLMVNGVKGGALAFFTPQQLLGWNMDVDPLPSFLSWLQWAKSLIQFLPTHYFYFGSQASQPAQLYTHQMQGVCLAFEKRDQGILSQPSVTLDTCRSFVAPDVLAQHEHQQAAQGKRSHYVHKFYHAYQSPEDSELLLRQGPELLRLHMGHDGENWGEALKPTTISSSPLLGDQERMAQTYSAFYDPLEGMANLVHFDALSTLKIPSAPVLTPAGDAGDASHSLQAQVVQELGRKDLAELMEYDAPSSAQSYLIKALKRYFCSFFTVYQGLDHLKADPGNARGDMPLYTTDMGIPREFSKTGAHFLVFQDTHSGKYFFLELIRNLPIEVDPEQVAIFKLEEQEQLFSEAELTEIQDVLSQVTESYPFVWKEQGWKLSEPVVSHLHLESKEYLKLSSETRNLFFKIHLQPFGVEVAIDEMGLLKFRRRELHLYRGDSKVIVDSGETDVWMDGNREHVIRVGGQGTLPLDCESLKQDGVVKTQSVHQLKVSAVDEWREGFDPFPAAIQPYVQEVRAALEGLEGSPEGQWVIALNRRLRSSLLAPEFVDALAHVSVPAWEDRRPEMTEKQLRKLVRQILKKRPFGRRMQQVLSPSGLGDGIEALAQRWAGYQSTDTAEVKQLKAMRERFLILFLNQFIAQLVMYTEYFSPLVAQSYETFFPDRTPIPEAQQALLHAVEFPDVDTRIRQEVVDRLSRYLSFEIQGTHIPADRVWGRLKVCSMNRDLSEARCDGQDRAVSLSESSLQFLDYFIKSNFQWALRSKGIASAQLTEVLKIYRELFVKKVYFVGIEPSPSPADPVAQVLPLTFFLIHQRPNLAAFSSEGRPYLDDSWGDSSPRSGLFHPYFDLTYLFRVPRPALNRYEEDSTYLNRWGIGLASRDRVSGRLYQEEAGRWLARGFEQPTAALSLDKIATWLVTTPFKTTEFSALMGTGEFSPAQLSHEAEQAQARFRQRQGTLSDLNAMANRAWVHFGVDREYPWRTDADGLPLRDEEGKPLWIDGADRYHFDFLNLESLSPADDHWVFFNRGFRVLPDLFFQTLWDKWVHIPQAQEAIPVPSRLRDGTGVKFPELFSDRHQSLHQFIHKPLEDLRAQRRLYDLDHVDQLWEVIHQLYTDDRLRVAGDIPVYHDLLSLEVMFPMVWRYTLFPKHFQEFDQTVAQDCNAYFRDPQIDFEWDSRACLEARTKRHLRSYYDDPEFFFVWDFQDWRQDEEQRFGFQHTFEKMFSKYAVLDPFASVENISPGVLPFNDRFWLTQSEGDLRYVPGYSGKSGVAGQAQKQYAIYLDRYHLRDSGKQHLWVEKTGQTALDFTPMDVFCKVLTAISGGLLTCEPRFALVPVAASNIRGFFELGNQWGGELMRVAQALGLAVVDRNKIQRYERAGTLMPEGEVNFHHAEGSREVEVSGCLDAECFDEVFVLEPDHWEWDKDKTAQRQSELSVRRQILQQMAHYIETDAFAQPSQPQSPTYRMYVADWEIVSPQKQVVAVNIIQSLRSDRGEVHEFPMALIFKFEKMTDGSWLLPTPVTDQVQQIVLAHMVGPMEIQTQGPTDRVCAPYIMQSLTSGASEEGGQGEPQLIPVFVKRCSRFVDQQQLKSLAEWLEGR